MVLLERNLKESQRKIISLEMQNETTYPVQVLMPWEVTYKVRELRNHKRVKVSRSFFQKTFHIMEQKEATIV